MKILSFTLLLIVNLCMAQEYPCLMTLVASKDSVASNEEFTATFSLSGVEGYVYIGVQRSCFEAIGNDRWEGEIKPGETKSVTFTFKLKDRCAKSIFLEEINPLGISWDFQPFDKKGVYGGIATKGVLIKIKDYQKLMENIKKSIKPGGNQLQLYPKKRKLFPDALQDTIKQMNPVPKY